MEAGETEREALETEATRGGAFCEPVSGIQIQSDAALAHRMREGLAGFLQDMKNDRVKVHIPVVENVRLTRGMGHFHLAPELFLQLSGTTRFQFPSGELILAPGEIALLPPKLQHVEQAAPEESGHPFGNLVIYSEGPYYTCHLAHEIQSGKPGVQYLETRHHPHASRILDWLSDAARLSDAQDPFAHVQARALVLATLASALRSLDDATPDQKPEPALISRVRLFIQNQLGDHELSVRRLAEQSGCTADYLSHIFSSTTGEHLIAHVTRLRMARASRLLVETGLSIKEIAWACGYSTSGYFIRTFRDSVGQTPKSWRESRRKTA